MLHFSICSDKMRRGINLLLRKAQKPGKCVVQTLTWTVSASQSWKSMSIDNIDFRILMHTSAIVRPVPAYIAHTPYIRCKHYVFLYVCMMNYGQTSGFPETLGFIRPIGTGALWSRSGRKPFGAFRQPKLSVFGPYTGCTRQALPYGL